MESNSTNEEYFIGAGPLPEPHFDEEATVLAARPVVPLDEVKAEESSRKRLLFGLAMAFSLTMGALAATLIYKQRGEGQSRAISTAVPGAAGIVVDEPVRTTANVEAVGDAAAEKVPEADASTVDRESPAPVSQSTIPTAVEKRTLSQEVEESELTRAERISERRLRRRAERQARRESGGRPRRASDDLLKIRDIFEGPARP